MSVDQGELHKRIDELRDEMRSVIASNERERNEVLTRMRYLETTVARAQGAKAGIIFSFSLMWAITLAAVAALWKWLK